MNTTERILFILFGALGYSEILSVVLPQLRIQVCCSHYFWFQKLCLLDIRICFGPVLAKPAMFYPVKTWKYKYTIYMIYHDIISSSCWKSWGKPKPLRGKRNLRIESFRQSCFIASLLQQNNASVRISINYLKKIISSSELFDIRHQDFHRKWPSNASDWGDWWGLGTSSRCQSPPPTRRDHLSGQIIANRRKSDSESK